jgi:hypothetical protein
MGKSLLWLGAILLTSVVLITLVTFVVGIIVSLIEDIEWR